MPQRSLYASPFATVAYAMLSLSWGCGAPQYDAPVSIPPLGGPGAVGFLQPLEAQVWPHGGTYAPAPASARVLSARCEDPSICEAFTDGKPGSYRTFIGGAKAGSTVVDVTIEHPTLHTTSEHKVPISFRDVELAPMKVGNASGQIDGKLQILTGLANDPKRYFCEEGAGAEALRAQLDIGDVVRGPGVLYVCAAPVELEHGSYFVRNDSAGSWAGPFEKLRRKTLHVCVHERTRGREIVSISIYDSAHDRLSLVERRGDEDPVCSPKR